MLLTHLCFTVTTMSETFAAGLLSAIWSSLSLSLTVGFHIKPTTQPSFFFYPKVLVSSGIYELEMSVWASIIEFVEVLHC